MTKGDIIQKRNMDYTNFIQKPGAVNPKYDKKAWDKYSDEYRTKQEIKEDNEKSYHKSMRVMANDYVKHQI